MSLSFRDLLFGALTALAAAPPVAGPPAGRIRRIPSEHRTIQEAIDSASDGDTILVAPGRYVENIRFYGKHIVVASEYLRTRDPDVIARTIIDGSRPRHPDTASVVLMIDQEDTSAALIGFTLTGGTGTGGTGTVWTDARQKALYREGGGVLCELGSPVIEHNIIEGNEAVRVGRGILSAGGGGIRCGYAEPIIRHNVIRGNRGEYGAGIVLYHSAATVSNNLITGNTGGAGFGGSGMWVVGALSYRLRNLIEQNTIAGNVAVMPDSTPTQLGGKGGGLTIYAPALLRNNLVWGNRQASGGQIDASARRPPELRGNIVMDAGAGAPFADSMRFHLGRGPGRLRRPCACPGRWHPPRRRRRVRRACRRRSAAVSRPIRTLIRRHPMLLSRFTAGALAALPLVARPVPVRHAAPEIVEYVIPRPGNFPHDPAVAADGSVWYTDQRNSYIGRLDPGTGKIVDYPTPTPGSGPHGITVAPDGQVWYTGQGAGVLGRVDPTSGRITEFPLPAATRNPHTPVFHKGRVWFTDANNNSYGSLDPATGKATVYTAPTANSVPYGIVPAGDGSLWIALLGTNKLGHVDPATGRMREFELPAKDARPRRLQVAGDGTVWYTDYGRGYLGALDVETGRVREWRSPSDNAGPYGIAIGTDGRIWYCESRAGTMVAFDPKTEKMETVPIPTAGAIVRHMETDSTRHRIWLALSGTGRLGKIELGAR